MSDRERIEALERVVAILSDREGIAWPTATVRLPNHMQPKSTAGMANGRAKLTAEGIEKAKTLRRLGATHQAIGIELGVSGDTIRRLLAGKTYRWDGERTP
jgi:hypothetical protein